MPISRTVAVLAAGMLLTAALAGCGDDSSVVDPAPGSTSGTPTETSSTTGSATPTPPTGSDQPSITQTAGTVTVPAYFLGDTPQGPRLYREFHRVPTGDTLLATARLLLGTPDDPDYRAPLPAEGGIDAVDLTGSAIDVSISDPAWLSRGSLDKAGAKLAVQALVYTLQGAAGKRLPVTITAPGDGAPATTLFGVSIGTGLRAAQPLSVLAFASVTSPEQGSTVHGGLMASGVASSFEGTVPWTIHRGGASGAIVKRGSAQASGYLDKLYPWSVRIDLSSLPPGAYTFVAMTDDPSGGEGGGPVTDSKDFTLR